MLGRTAGTRADRSVKNEVVPSRREMKRRAEPLAVPPPLPAAKAARPTPPPSTSGYKAPPWASMPPAGTLPRHCQVLLL